MGVNGVELDVLLFMFVEKTGIMKRASDRRRQLPRSGRCQDGLLATDDKPLGTTRHGNV